MALQRICSVILAAALAVHPPASAATIGGPTVLPGTLSLTSADPDAVSSGGAATVTWSIADARPNGDWSLAVHAPSSTLTACPRVPVSALQVQCTGLSVAGTGNPRGECAAGAVTLSTNPQIIASGSRQGGNSLFTAAVSFTFIDSWKYPASSLCSLNLIYTVSAT